jgi:hypothetical protein
MSDLGTQLREYLDATAPPVEIEEIITDEVWIPATEEPRRQRLTIPGWAYGLAAMLVFLVLTLGLALLLPGADESDVIDEPTPPTTETSPPTMTQPPPSPDLTGDSGTLDTALGPIPWVHAAGIDAISLWGRVIQTPRGFAGIAETDVSDGRNMRLWVTSTDGVTWTEAPFPVPLDPGADVLLDEAQGRFWLTDGARLWLSDDADIWTEVDLSEITPPPSDGVMWTPGLESPAVNGDLAIFSLRLRAELPLREIFDPGSEFAGGVYSTNCGWDWELDACQGVGDDVDVVFGIDGDTREETLLARFRVDVGDGTAHVVDIDTGTRVHGYSVPGFDGEELTGIPDWNALVRVGPELTASVIEPPWSSFGLRGVFVAAVDGRFFAYVDSGPRRGATTLDAIEAWESDDGLTWTNRGTVDFGIEASGEVDVMTFQHEDHLITHINFTTGQGLLSETRLISTDGLSWRPDGADPPEGWVEPIGGGFVSFGDDGIFVSEDGDQWEELIFWSPRRGMASIAGDTLIVGLDDDIWAFDLES